MYTYRATALAAVLLLAPSAASAQSIALGVEATTDERRRGLSWSDGDPAVSADASAALAGFDVSARAVTTRRSTRHAGADAVADLEVSRRFDIGAVSLRARGIGHLFAGAAGRQDYGELGLVASYTLGPTTVDAGATYAPDQAAIGGDNLYLFADARAGIPATPFTFTAGVGRSSGSVDDAVRAERLRPAGRYTDWRAGVSWVTSPVTLTVEYVGTDIDQNRLSSPFGDIDNAGDRIIGRVRFGF